MPGPSVLFVVARALAGGRSVALRSVVGNTFGEYLQVVAVAFGAGTLATRSVAAFTALKLAGGAYLVYLGVATFRKRRRLPGALADPEGASGRRPVLQGLLVGATNPKTVVFLAAVLPQFAVPSRGHVPEQILLLGAMFSAVALLSDSAWALAADRFRSWFARSPRRLELVGGAGGLAIVAIGLRLALTGRRD